MDTLQAMNGFAVLENHQRRNTGDAITNGEILRFVNVHLCDNRFAALLYGYFIDKWAKNLRGATLEFGQTLFT